MPRPGRFTSGKDHVRVLFSNNHKNCSYLHCH